MWVLKLKVDSTKQFIGSLAIKHRVSAASYTISYYKDKKWIYLTACGFIFGDEQNKKDFVEDLEKQPQTIHYEFNKGFGIGVIKQPLYTEAFWDPKLIRLSPTIINYKEKNHTWHLGSFEKKPLMNIYKLAKKHLGAKLIKLKQEKISNISITSVLPDLTPKQKRAFEIAINNGYYEQPRKIYLEKLAEIMKISYPTYQEHLRKAEAKIIPKVYRDL